jgi:pimeloyl-ACP methyl ester carboxylesterase
MIVTKRTVAAFLTPDGFSQPSVAAVLREGSLVAEAGRYAVQALSSRGARRRTSYTSRPARAAEPVLLVPGFLAGDSSLGPMSRSLRHEGFRTYRADIRANVGCTLAAADQLEERLEEISQRRGSRVRVVGHSLGGMLARGVAARRPDRSQPGPRPPRPWPGAPPRGRRVPPIHPLRWRRVER